MGFRSKSCDRASRSKLSVNWSNAEEGSRESRVENLAEKPARRRGGHAVYCCLARKRKRHLVHQSAGWQHQLVGSVHAARERFLTSGHHRHRLERQRHRLRSAGSLRRTTHRCRGQSGICIKAARSGRNPAIHRGCRRNTESLAHLVRSSRRCRLHHAQGPLHRAPRHQWTVIRSYRRHGFDLGTLRDRGRTRVNLELSERRLERGIAVRSASG